MTEPGPETLWFDVGAQREAAAEKFRNYQVWAIAAMSLMFVLGTAAVMWVEGASRLAMGIFGGLVFVGFAAVAVTLWFRRNRKPKPSKGVDRLGVDRAGVWWQTSEGASHMPWARVGGVRVHCAYTAGVGASRVHVYLDLLHPGQPIAGHGAQGTLQRTELSDGNGMFIQAATEYGTRVGQAMRAVRPDLWRGFTTDPGSGYVEFKSWDTAVNSVADNLKPLSDGFQTPSWNNFGADLRRPPH